MAFIFNNMTYIYLFVIPVVFFVLIFKCYFINKNHKEFTKFINLSFFSCFGIIFVHCFLLTTSNYSFARILYSVNFIFLDFIVFFVFHYVKSYVKFNSQKNLLFILLSVPFSIDILFLLLNPFTQWNFSIERMNFLSYELQYWSLKLKLPMIYHYALCGATVLATEILLLLKTRKVPSIYKIKYNRFMIFYLLIVSFSYLSNLLDLPQDLSIYFYGFITDIAFNFSLLRTNDVIKVETLGNIVMEYPLATCWFDNTNTLFFVNDKAKQLFSSEKNRKRKSENRKKKSRNISHSFFFTNIREFKNFKKINTNRLENYLMNFIKENYARNLDMVISDEILTINGEKKLFEITYRKLYSNNEYIGCYMNFRDKTEETKKYLKDFAIATHDPLTGIYNRQRFFKEADDLMNDNPNKKWLMLCTNIQNFKLLNDMLGHEIGDSILIQQAENLKNVLSNKAIFGRIVDDKFAILIEKNKFSENLIQETIIDVVKVNDENFFYMKVFVGVYESGIVRESARFMFDKALMAIENLSTASQNNFSYYNETIMKKFLNDRSIVSDFDFAYASRQFSMYLQPLFNQFNKTIGAEALLRWEKPGVPILFPSDFIYIFEKYGLLYKLDLYMWEETAKKLRDWKNEQKLKPVLDNNLTSSDYFICVNISANDMYYVDIYSVFCQLIEKYDLNPKMLKLEITETFLVKDFEKSTEVFGKLSQRGFDIVIDDFGEKYASLNMLKQLNASYLRIDFNKLQPTEDSSKGYLILENLVELAKNLDMEIIADCVETKEQYDIFKKLGSNIFQGFYLAEPTAAKDFDKDFLS